MNALLVIDMQGAYFKDNPLEKQRRKLIENIQKQINIFSNKNNLIINVTTVHRRDKTTWTLNMLEDNQGFLFSGEEETSTLLHFPKTITTIQKTRDSAFHETNLIKLLKEKDVQRVTLAGVSAHTCIFHTASAAYAYDLPVTLLKNCIGDENQEAMQQALNYLSKEYRQVIV